MNSDNRIVMTLDAGGTNMVFSAIRGGEEIVEPVTLPTCNDNLDKCLETMKSGFTQIMQKLGEKPVAISFAFPGPADYSKGIIGDLPNFPAFRGGVALGPYLEEQFGMPVFINNDGNLFAYGEALSGALSEVNAMLEKAGSKKRYSNLAGFTLGTGFGAGVVIGGELLRGDNETGGDVWCFRNKKYSQYIVEESVSIRAVKRVYRELSGDETEKTPKEIYDIAEGIAPGNREAALSAFAELGEMAGEAIAAALTIVDGIVVIGGGVSGAAKYIMPRLLQELRSETGMMNGVRFSRLQMEVYNLDDEKELAEFLKDTAQSVVVPGTDKTVSYDPVRKTGIMLSRQGTNRSIALGAYQYAINHLK